ncbi:MAG: transposase [Gammaproteobacteria bacterium]|nr:transposase [Gammaproteobacteria bacterium]
MVGNDSCEIWPLNGFLQWVPFGGNGVIAENLRHEQRKIIKYNHLVANLLILHNVATMTKTLSGLIRRGYDIIDELLAKLIQ